LAAGTPAARAGAVRAGRASPVVTDAAMVRRLERECAPPPVPAAPVVAGTASRVVEFPGRLPRVGPGAGAVPGALLTLQGEDLVLRRPPEFTAAWRAPLQLRDPIVLGTAPGIVLWDDSVPGWGAAVAIDADGRRTWRSPRTGEIFGGAAGEYGSEAPPVELADGRTEPAAQVIPLLAADALVLARRDGRIAALRTSDGTVAWKRDDAFRSVSVAARDDLAVVLGGQGPESDTAAVRVQAIDPATGTPFLAFAPEGASEVRWVRIERGGILVLATDAGIEARRLGGGDEERPCWSVPLPEARGTARGWGAGRWVLALDRSDGIVAIDARTGAVARQAFRTADTPSPSPVRDVLAGDGWIALVREGRIDFFDMDGRCLGRDVPGDDHSYVAAAASRSRAFVLDTAAPSSDLSGGRLLSTVDTLDPLAGGRLAAPRIVLRMVGQRADAMAAIDGWVATSNGSVIQAIDLRAAQPAPAR
jgi:hypothetical protein